jgi:hypothetical protein
LLSPKLARHIAEIAIVAEILIIASAVTFHTGIRESFVTVTATESTVFPFPSVACAIPNIVFIGVRAVAFFGGVGVVLTHTAVISLVVLPVFPQAILFGCLSVRCPRCQEQRSDTR